MVRMGIYGLAASFALAATLGALIGSPAWAEGNAAAGKKVFKKCAACHTLVPGKKKIGPSLAGVIGRTAGTGEGFRYSKAMKAYGASGVVWDAASLDVYLTAPRKVVKGTKMSFPGLKKPEDRANLISFLEQAAAKD